MNKNDITLLISSHVPMTISTGSHAASIIILLIEDIQKKLFLLLTKRAENLLTYSGDYCFPGGVFEDTDIDLKTTAERELKEELGLSLRIL